MSAVADKLREARALIAKGWCQGTLARGKTNRPCDINSKAAVSWCSLGAMVKAELPFSAKGYLCRAIGESYVSIWNDRPDRTQAEVLAAFDKAIELAERAQ